MIKKYFLKVFCFLLWIGIFLVLSLVFTSKVSAQVCTFQDYFPLATPNSAYCTPYFPDTIAFPPCNSERVCSNKTFKANGAGTSNANCSVGGNVDGTTCCKAGLGFDFCDQRDLGDGVITQYQFRCCNIPPPTPTPTPTPSPCVAFTNCSTCITGPTCGWNGSSCQTGTVNTCPSSGIWNWTSCSVNQNVCILTPSPTPTQAAIYNCPVGDTIRDFRCSANNPDPSKCNPFYNPGIITSPCGTDRCWECKVPTPTPTPSATCNNSNLTVDNDCFKRNQVFCAVGSSCKQNPNSTTKDCTCQSDTLPTPTPGPTSTPTPIPSALCNNSNDTALNDCFKRNQVFCAVGSSCKQNSNSTTKDCTCQSDTAPTSTPTPTATPVPTPLPGSTLLALSVKVDGIPEENTAPVRPNRRVVAVIVRNSNNQEIAKTGFVNYSSATGLFTGTVDLGTGVSTTPSTIGVKMDLLKGFAYNISLAQGLNQLPQLTARTGLTDDDNKDPVTYYNALVSCFNGKPSCSNPIPADINDDGKVSTIDFQIFLKSLKFITSRSTQL